MEDLLGKVAAAACTGIVVPPTQIDPRTSATHRFLRPGDTVYCLGEYAAGAGPVTPTNDLIHNFKIRPSSLQRSPVRRRHKERAIGEVGALLSEHLSGLPTGAVIVPIPTSKLVTDPDYDDRLVRALRLCRAHPALDVRELIKQKRSTASDHEAPGRQTFRRLLGNSYMDDRLSLPRPSLLVLFDDVLTEGKHFKVCQRLLREHYGSIPVIGFFLARTIGHLGRPERPHHAYSRPSWL